MFLCAFRSRAAAPPLNWPVRVYLVMGIARAQESVVLFIGIPMSPKSPARKTLPTRRGKFRCVLVEDQVLFEQLLGSLIQAENLVDIVAAAHTVNAGIEACRQHRPDLLLLDLALPDGDGLAVARALAECRPEARTIVISGQADTFRCPPDLKQHIYSVIDKTRTLAAVRQEVSGCLGQMSPEAPPAGLGGIAQLSPREEEIFRLIGRGLSTKVIAAATFISPHTVSTHRKNIAAKLGLGASAMVRCATLHALTAGSTGASI